MNYNYNVKKNNTEIDINNFQTVVQTAHGEDVSNRYSFIPTAKVVNILDKEGWKPVNIQEARVLNMHNNGFQKHLIRFQNPNVRIENKDNLFPEIILTNSHNGLSSFQIMAGIFRQVCLNGLCVADSMFETSKIRHQGYTDEKIAEAVCNVVSSLPKISNRIEEFQSIQLSLEERQIFAEAALDLVFDDMTWEKQEGHSATPSKTNTAKILSAPRRQADSEDNLWNMYNRAQERLMKGGFYLVSEDGKYRMGNKSKGIKAIDKNIKLNKALWTLTEQMAKIKQNCMSN